MNIRRTFRCAPLAALAILVAFKGTPTWLQANSAPAPATAPAGQLSVVALRTTALGDDVAQSVAALRQLAAGDEPAKQAMRGVLPQLLARDAATLEAETAAASGQLPKLRSAEAEMEALRVAQLGFIANLTRDPKELLEARHNYDKLAAIQARLMDGYVHQVRVFDALGRLSQCLTLKPAGDPVPTSASDGERLDRLAEQALAMPPAVARGFCAGPLRTPADAAQRGLWFHLTCRRIEAWNRTIEPALNAGEAAHARRVNFYRELLGLLPYELDLRLTQAARRHSKEMVDLWYFSHWSPTESERDPFGRMARAGYADSSGENLHMGRFAAEEAFWSLFNSPSHHRAWTDPDATALGVGKWENAWTEDFGAGPRLMTATPEQRAKAVILGEELKPQLVEATRRRPRDMRDIKFYDEWGREIQPGTKDNAVPLGPGGGIAAKPSSKPTSNPATAKPQDAGTGTVETKGPEHAAFRWRPAGPATEPSRDDSR